MTALDVKAESFLALHVPGDPVVLPTVWDAWSANLAVDSGFAALTVGSHPVADSIGRSDGEGMTFRELLGRVREITDAVHVPVSVDVESGYGLAPTQLIEGLLDVGAIGLNVEDTVHSEGGRLRSPQEHADLVAGMRQVADAAGVHVVVNARTDLFLRADGDAADRVDRAVARLRLAADAGADVLYPVGRHDDGHPAPPRRHGCRCRSTRSHCPPRATARRWPRRGSGGTASARSSRRSWRWRRSGCWRDGGER